MDAAQRGSAVMRQTRLILGMQVPVVRRGDG